MKDKIIFWLDSELLSYSLAYYLQKNLDSELYAIIDITNISKKFFQEQNLVKFQKTWFGFGRNHLSIMGLLCQPIKNLVLYHCVNL